MASFSEGQRAFAKGMLAVAENEARFARAEKEASGKVPNTDRPHVLSADCWCKPERTNYGR